MIVGIGASAGGIQALQEFFRHVPESSNVAYVVILHLSPDHDSQLAAVLQQVTKVLVIKVTERTVIQPDHIYVVSPDRHLTMEDGYIAVSPNLNVEERRAPVDIFFRTLADQHGPRAISVILSGTGANGSMGLKRIKERGGATYVQNPREAEFNEMPRNAIATELVDEVLNVAEIPARIIAYRDSIGTVEIIEETEKRPELQQQALRDILTQLRIRTGHDFSNYKRPTLLRRIERRINVHNLHDLPSYIAFLHEHPDETYALLKDLLISVTNFFRDKKPFNALEHDVLPAIFAGKTSADQVRIWVAGCATGEEAYSLAMLCAELSLGSFDAPKVQIFATDIDEAAISTAREGIYSLNDAADVSPERLRRFFTSDGDRYRVRREIRQMILFANHNFLKDPPFSKLELVTCRNVLIYLNSTAQERVIETFHFALRPKGFLFLGTSESVDGASDLYAVFNRDNHIFQTREVAARSYPVPDSVPQFVMSKTELLQKPDERESRNQRISFGELHQKMLEQYAPPSVVINEEYEVVHMTERAGKYFEFSGGEPTQNLLKLIRSEIRLELRSALYQAVQNHTAVEARNIKLTENGQPQSIDIHVRPVLEDGDTAKGFILVIFKPAQEPSPDGATVMVSSDEPVARQLEGELIGLKTQLRNSIEQHEYQAEELKASNEELQAMNEELRSAAEELETSKEELQSINEELRTVNQELKVKIDETSVTSNNLQNLINSANVGTIFLDRSFAIRLFTPAILDIFNLKSGDYGRPITDITNKLQYDGLLQDAETVLEKLTIVEQEVNTSDNRFFLMRLLPYRTAEDRINGVVITFFDITRRRKSEEALRQSEEKYRIQLEQEVEARTAELQDSKEQYSTLVSNTPDVITRWNKQFRLVFANTAFEQKSGVKIESLLEKTNSEMGLPDEFVIPYLESLRKAFKTGETVEHFNSSPTPDGEAYFYSRLTPERNAAGEVETVLAVARDITEIRKAEQKIKESRDLLQSILDNSSIAICVLKAQRDESGKILDFEIRLTNQELNNETGRSDLIGKLYAKEYPGIKLSGLFDVMLRVMATGQSEGLEYLYPYDGFDKWYSCMFVKMEDGLLTTNMDISERKKAEEYVRKSEEKLRMFITASSDLIYQMSADWERMHALHSEGFLSKTESPSSNWMDNYIPSEERQRVQAAIDHAIAQKQTFELEHRVLTASGDIGWANSRAIPLLNDEDEIIEWFGVASDITARKLGEDERYRNYLLLQQAEELANIGIWDYDLLTSVFTWSDGMYRLFDLKKGIEVNPEIYLTNVSEQSQDIAKRVVELIKTGVDNFEETLHMDFDGKSKILKLKATVLRNNAGKPVRVLGVDIDITSTLAAEAIIKEMEAKQQLEIFRNTLVSQEEERRRISESLHNGLGQLLYGISIAMSHVTLEKALKNPDKFGQSQKYAEQLLADAIQESRRISHELMPTTLEEFGLQSAIEDVCQQLSGNVKFHCTYSGLNRRLENYLELAVFRTVQELMLNVVKHAKASECSVTMIVEEDYININVTDNGIGMPELIDKKTGIGLTSIRSKIKLLNGQFKVSVALDQGTTIEIYIPLKQ